MAKTQAIVYRRLKKEYHAVICATSDGQGELDAQVASSLSRKFQRTL